MYVSAIFLLTTLALPGNAHLILPRVEQSLEGRTTYEGGWALHVSNTCPQNYSVACGGKTDQNQVCCPNGNTCFGSSSAYCCPTSQDCTSRVTAFPICVDPTANMYAWLGNYFCCPQGFNGVSPLSGPPFCQGTDFSVPQSLLATMISQYGGTSVTPFGGFGTLAPVTTTVPVTATINGVVVTTASAVTQTPANTNPVPIPTASSSSSSTSSPSKPFDLTTGAIAGIAIAAAFLLALIYMIWKCCSHRNWSSRSRKDYANPLAPSYMNSYPPVSAMYAPTPAPVYSQTAYDPVRERSTAVSPLNSGLPPSAPMSPARTPMSPVRTPMSPAPEYKAVDAHELSEERIRLVQVDGTSSTRGRAEMG